MSNKENNQPNLIDNPNNELVNTLSFMARWKAFVRKYRGYTSTYKDEEVFIKELEDYQKNWLKDGLGSPLAKVNEVDVIEALIDFNITLNQIKDFNLNDCRLYFDALLALEYDGDE